MRLKNTRCFIPSYPIESPRNVTPSLTRSCWIFPLVSLLILVPCYWQSRIQAGDLSSHIYNSWLSQLIDSGQTEGLIIVRQYTNIAFDLLLDKLFRLTGADAAQRIAVSVVVLIFVWGSFSFVSVVSGRLAWTQMPCIAMLAYGWVYHMGFFNFYLSLGLCFLALALLWKPSVFRCIATVPILILACIAHLVPLAWIACLLLYKLAAHRLTARSRIYLIVGSLAIIFLLHFIIAKHLWTRWSPDQIAFTTGCDQIIVFDAKYHMARVGILLVWGLLFVKIMHNTGALQLISGVPFQFCALSAFAVFILPSAVAIPGHGILNFIAERMSLGVGICICSVLGAARPRRFEQCILMLSLIIFFSFLYRDERALNLFEDRMHDAVASIAPGQRVISAITDNNMRVNALTHMIDRVCMGHCYSYANYEASTGQFRIRAIAPNPFVAYTFEQSQLIEVGQYRIQEYDVPMFQVNLDEDGRMVVNSLHAGMLSGSRSVKVLPRFLPRI